MSIADVPREVLDRILGQVLRKKDLASAALVNTYWLGSVRPLLFSSIYVECDIPVLAPCKKLTQLIAFLESSVVVCQLVRELHLAGPDPQGDFRASMVILTSNTLDEILRRLPHLKKLRMEYARLGRCTDVAGSYALYQLEDLTLENVGAYGDDVVNFLGSLAVFSKIERLTLKRPLLRQDSYSHHPGLTSSPSPDPGPLYLAVSTFRLERAAPWVVDILCGAFRRTGTPQVLKSFTFDCSPFGEDVIPFDDVHAFLGDATPTLEHIKILMNQGPWAGPEDYSASAGIIQAGLARCSALCSCAVELGTYSSRARSSSSPRWPRGFARLRFSCRTTRSLVMVWYRDTPLSLRHRTLQWARHL